MKYLILFSFLAVGGLSACSSGDSGPTKITKCGKKWKLLAIDRKAQEKTDMSTTEPKLPAGRYDAGQTSLFYWDKEADIRMQFSSGIDSKTGEMKMSVECLGGTGVDTKMEPLKIAVPFVSTMLVDANGKTILSTRTMIVELGHVPGKPLLRMTSAETSKDVNGSIKDTYQGYPNTAHFLYKLNEKSYETRTQLHTELPGKEVDQGLDVRVSVNYTKDSLVDPETPETAAAPQVIQE